MLISKCNAYKMHFIHTYVQNYLKFYKIYTSHMKGEGKKRSLLLNG